MSAMPMPVLDVRTIYTVASVPIRVLGSGPTFFFEAGMAVDADGSPHAYHPEKGKGLDNLGNAGHAGNWYGVVTDTGKANGTPIVQGPKDPAPGFYVSPTALQNRHLARTDPRRYVDSATIPYISLPGHSEVLKARLGDVAMVINGHNGRKSAAIYADVGPRKKIGEGSIALAHALGLNESARNGGTGHKIIVYIVFPHSGNGSPMELAAIQSTAKRLFDVWGGMRQVASLFPEFPNLTTIP